jgi:hypothetical protein
LVSGFQSLASTRNVPTFRKKQLLSKQYFYEQRDEMGRYMPDPAVAFSGFDLVVSLSPDMSRLVTGATGA